MSYENAVQTKMLATHCAVCARPLCDAQSVEMGIGPECRKKYGWGMECSDDIRTQANVIVYEIAIKQDGPEVASKIGALRALGFTTLADKIADRVCALQSKEVNGVISLKAPYSEAGVAAFRAIPGRWWDPAKKVTTFPSSSRNQLWSALKKVYAGCLLKTGSGMIIQIG